MSQPRIGLALAGGGPLGAIYEVGALCALEEAIEGLDFTACDGYIGVSAGGFIAAGLANGMTPRQLCAASSDARSRRRRSSICSRWSPSITSYLQLRLQRVLRRVDLAHRRLQLA